MPDSRFFDAADPLSFEEACALAAAKPIAGAGGAPVARVADLEEATLEGAAVFCEIGPRARELAARLAEGAAPPELWLVTDLIAKSLESQGAIAVCDNPKAGFARLAARLHKSKASLPVGVDGAGAADLHDTVRLGPGAVVCAGASLAEGVFVGPGAVIGPGVEIGPQTVIGPGAMISHAVIGARVVIGPGVVIGEAGFGFVEGPDGAMRVPQLGIVEIGDDVEIGANTTVDRATLGATVIGAGTKIDNLVQIAHNVEIGRGCMIAGQAGFSGGAKLGDAVMAGGQIGVGNNVEVGDGARLGAKSGFMRNVPAGETWGGVPAEPQHLWWRSMMFIRRGRDRMGTGRAEPASGREAKQEARQESRKED